MTNSQHPPAWHPDPTKRYQMRYWDGAQWTEHVSNDNQQIQDAEGKEMANTGQAVNTGFVDGEMFGYTTPQQVQAQVAKAQTSSGSIIDAMQIPDVASTQVPPPEYERSIFTENIIVVNQKAKLMELTAEYGLFDQSGNQLGAIRQVGQSTAKKVARAFTNLDSMMTHKLEIVDMAGNLQFKITKPRAIMKPKVIIEKADGTPVGELEIKIRIGKSRIKMLADGQQLGTIYAKNFRAWNFSIQDSEDQEIATISKTWEGFAKMMFTTADNYVLQINQKLSDPLHSLVLAGALAVDLILKQNDNGLPI